MEVKRGRPLGSRNKKRRGRPLGSKNKLTEITPIIKVGIKCIICKRYYAIRVDKSNFLLYTKEYKKNYVCLICKDTWKDRLLKQGLIEISKTGKIIYL